MKLRIHLIQFFILPFFLISTSALQLKAQVANFSLSSNKGCAPLSGVAITNLSTGGTTYDWDFGNGNKSTTTGNQSANYPNPGKYVVRLTLNGTSTHYDTVTVFANPVANYIINSAMPACVGQAITFTSSSTPGSGTITSWAWDFNDGTTLNTTVGTATHAYASTKTTTITLIVTDNNGCIGNSSSSPSVKPVVTILASPKAVFTATPLSSCTAPLTVTFTNTSTATGASYKWDFGDATTSTAAIPPAHVYNALGTYPIKLVVTQGSCKDSSTQTVIIKTIVADFKTDKTIVCLGKTVKFTDASAPLSTSRTWDFGDATAKSTDANPIHTYTAIGTYTVTLDATVTTATGKCSNSVTKTIEVVAPPVPTFTSNIQKGCSVPFTVTFTNTTTPSVSTYLWDFGDGATSSTTNIHTYTAPGAYTVKLLVTNASGCKDSITKINYIEITRPTAKFTATPREGCFPLKVKFTSASISTVEPIVSYVWTFGNGTTKTTTTDTTSALYPLEGFYDVKLVIITASGCKDSVTYIKYIKVGSKPKADFSVDNPIECYGIQTVFNDLSSANADSAYWDFGDGTLSTLLKKTPVKHLYNLTPTPLPNIYTVKLITYNKGCPDTLEKKLLITINAPRPIFAIKPIDCTKPYLREFVSTSIGADSLRWDFGDGTPILLDSVAPKHTYATTGIKIIKLTAINKTTGCSFTIPQTITIADPVASFTSELKGCYPFVVTFVNTSVDASTYNWAFGDGTPNEITPIPKPHTYNSPKLYTAQLIITDVNSCKDTVSKTINIQGPKPAFTADTTKGCTPLLVKFTDKTVSDSTLTQWTWNFGDGTPPTTVTTVATSHIYTIPGAYKVTLTSTDKNNCTSTLEKINYIIPTFPFPKFTADTLSCKGKVISFNATTTVVAGTAPKFEWNFGDGTPMATGITTTHAYTKDSLYTVTLKVTDGNGCDSTITKKIRIQNPTVAFKHLVLEEKCGFIKIEFTDASIGSSINNWDWDFGDGSTATKNNKPTHSYTTPGVYSVKLKVTNAAGCTNTITLDSLIVVPGPIGTFSFTPKKGCKPFTVTFTANSTNSTNYTWDFGDGVVVSGPAKTIQHTYTQDITATPILVMSTILTNNSLCKLPAPTAGPVTVASVISVDIDSLDVILGEDETLQLTSVITGTTSATNYTWTPPNALSCTDCPNPTVTGEGNDKTYTYYLNISEVGGCKTYDSVRIHFPKCVNDKFLIPNVFTPNGDKVNDLFDITGLCNKNDYKLTIFNNWGVEMFSTNDRHKSWDGKMMKNGLEVSSGVYYYILLMDGKAHKGFIHLIR